VDVNLKFALVLVVGFTGVAVMVVSGGVASTVHVLAFAGDLSVFPAGSVARTWKACFPSTKGAEVHGLVHAVKAAVSRLHSNVLPVTVEVKEKVALVLLVAVAGLEVIIVSGTGAMVQLKFAGVGSVLPRESVACTWKL